MSNVIEKARELGKALQEDPRYNAYVMAKAANDCDVQLQEMIMKFNETRNALNAEMGKQDKSTEEITRLDSELRALYDSVMSNEHMAAFDKAKADMDEVLESINYIVTAAANGQDPLTCPETAPHSCTGSCGTCGGCH